MIEFEGYISGKTEKNYYKRNCFLILRIFWIAMVLSWVLILPFTSVFPISLFVWIWAIAMVTVSIIIVLASFFGGKKDRPKRIYTEDDCIICVTDETTETKYIEDVKEVIDRGEYYQLVFAFGNISNRFICQKDLLSKGTIEEFEALFPDKIVR